MFFTDRTFKPLQLYHLSQQNVSCQLAEPCEAICRYVHYYWWLEVNPGSTSLEIIPDNAIDLVMAPELPEFSILYLPATERFSIPLVGPMVYVGISFRAEMACDFFNVDHGVLKALAPGTDTTTMLAIEKMVDGVLKLSCPDELSATMDRLAKDRLACQSHKTVTPTNMDMNKVLVAMQASIGTSGMQAVAERFGMSDRQFRRIMSSLFGYGPKKIQRIMRLQASLKEQLQSDSLKTDDGFYDEAHRIKEIRALTGLTPTEIHAMSEIYNSMQ